MTAHTTEPQPEPARELLRADLLIIGSGIAGLFVALQAHQRGAKVLVVTKSAIDEASTRYAQGGISAAIGPGDSPELHLRDTIEAGAGLVDAAAARVLVEEAAGRIADLGSYGVRFDEAEGEAALGKEGAHSARRVLRARGDQTGLEIELSLSSLVQREGITVLEHALAERLLVADGRAIGADVLCADDGARLRCEAETVVLATGGAGQVYRVTTNPQIATGDGIALAFRAGAEVQDMEFTQFHPTALRLEGQPSFLISEAVRGEGALLFDTAGRRFMADHRSGGGAGASQHRRAGGAGADASDRQRPRAAGHHAPRRCLGWPRASRTSTAPASRPASTWRATASRSRRRRTTRWAACARTPGAARRCPASTRSAR